MLKTNSVTPDFFTFFIESYHFLPSVKVLKKSVCGKLLGANVPKWGRKRDKRFASLSEGKMQFLTERHSGKTKQITNWSVSSSKVKLKFFRFKIVKYETRAFKRKIETKPIRNLFILLNISCLPRTITSDIVVRFSRRDFMRNSTGYVTKQLAHAFSCALSSYGALGKFGEHSRS